MFSTGLPRFLLGVCAEDGVEDEAFTLELACGMIGDTPQKDGIQVVHQESDLEKAPGLVRWTSTCIKPINIYRKLCLSSFVCTQYCLYQIVSQAQVYISCPTTIVSKHLPHQYMGGHVFTCDSMDDCSGPLQQIQ